MFKTPEISRPPETRKSWKVMVSWWLNHRVEKKSSNWITPSNIGLIIPTLFNHHRSNRSEILITPWFSLLPGLSQNNFDWSYSLRVTSTSSRKAICLLGAWKPYQRNNKWSSHAHLKGRRKKTPYTPIWKIQAFWGKGLGQLAHDFLKPLGLVQVFEFKRIFKYSYIIIVLDKSNN